MDIKEIEKKYEEILLPHISFSCSQNPIGPS
jgi:hypothetical protein